MAAPVMTPDDGSKLKNCAGFLKVGPLPLDYLRQSFLRGGGTSVTLHLPHL